MRNRIKIYVICMMLLVAVFLEPVLVVKAEESDSSYSSDVPYLVGIEVELGRSDSANEYGIFGFLDKQREIYDLVFTFDRLSSVDYSLYELVFDFELKSLLDDGTVSNHCFTKVCDFGDSNSPGFFDSILISLSIKDDYFKQEFLYVPLLKYSSDFKYIGSVMYPQYNTVISSVDCYLREKSTGNIGLKSRFKFTWDSNFYNQLCNSITYELVLPDSDSILETDGIKNDIFAGSFSSDGDNEQAEWLALIAAISGFLVNIPSAIVSFVEGFFSFANSIPELFSAIFPFVPAVVFDIFGVLIFLIPVVGIWFFLKGK